VTDASGNLCESSILFQRSGVANYMYSTSHLCMHWPTHQSWYTVSGEDPKLWPFHCLLAISRFLLSGSFLPVAEINIWN